MVIRTVHERLRCKECGKIDMPIMMPSTEMVEVKGMLDGRYVTIKDETPIIQLRCPNCGYSTKYYRTYAYAVKKYIGIM